MSGIEVLGAIAAALQLADGTFKACVKTVELLSRLKHAPKAVIQGAADLEELMNLIKSLRSLEDIQSIGIADAKSVKELLDKLNSLGPELSDKLKPLQAQSGDHALQRLWRDIVSVKRQSELLSLLDQTLRTKSSLSNLLSGLGLRALYELKTINASEHYNLKDIVKTQHTSGQAALSDSKHVIINAVETSGISQQRRMEQLQSITVDSKVAIEAQSVRLEDLGDRLETSISNSTVRLEKRLKQVESQLTVLVSSIPVASSGLIAKPQVLAEACNRTSTPSTLLHSSESSIIGHKSFADFGCRCSILKFTEIRKWGSFTFFNMQEVDHISSCPFHLSKISRHSRGFCVPLLPLLAFTVEIMFNKTTGAGGNSVAPTLRFYGTIQRSQSPVFALFDKMRRGYRRIPGDQTKEFLSCLADLHEGLAGLLASDPSHASTRDENGWTILHVRNQLSKDVSPFGIDSNNL
jgi:hypothetical protein